ncbi:MAG: VOC family protein [Pseudomonadota bacterium]
MDNTAIELFSSDLRQIKAGIRAVVFAATNMEKTSDQSINGERFYYHYDDSAGSQNQQNVLVLAGREGVAYQILLADPGGRTSDQHIAGDICSVDHLVLSSNDAEACLNLFGDSGLGLRLALDKHAPQWGGRMLFYRSGGMTLEIIISDKPSVHPDRFWGIAYDCADIAASVKRLNEAGVEVSEIRSGRKPNTLVATIKSHTAGVPTLLVEQGEQTPG